jgi:hypothetical protein
MSSADNLSKHRTLVDSPELQRALDFAMLEYQARILATTSDTAGAAPGFFRLLGAQEFVQTLRNLSEKPPTPVIVDKDNLSHRP